jgi:hypothetical protein
MMRNIGVVFVMGLAAAVLQGCVVPVERRVVREEPRYGREEPRWVYCGGEHRLRVLDLDMSPDPVREGERVRAWRVRLRADASGECRTSLQIRETRDRDLVGLARVYDLRPGTNEIDFQPNERYHFSRSEHCFEVIADIAGTGRRVDAARIFCARQIAGRRWTLR